MDYREETEAEHRARDARTWEWIGIFGYFFSGLRGWIAILLFFVGVIWVMNMLGESTMFNDPDIYYSGKDPRTGQMVVVQGCRPERVLPDGSCNKSIDLATIKKAFPFFGPARQVPVQ